MNVISRSKLKAFYASKPAYKRHSTAFEQWFKLSRKARWNGYQDARNTFGQTDVVKDTASRKSATIFDIGGNKYRIVALVDYIRQTILITHVLTHAEYSTMKWKNDI